MEPVGFSADLNAYLKKVLADNGKEDRSGRWLEEVTGHARRYDYWSKLVKDSRAMTTNDIDVLAKTFGTTPVDWVTNTQRYAAGEAVPVLLVQRNTNADAFRSSEDPGDAYPNAAKQRPSPEV